LLNCFHNSSTFCPNFFVELLFQYASAAEECARIKFKFGWLPHFLGLSTFVFFQPFLVGFCCFLYLTAVSTTPWFIAQKLLWIFFSWCTWYGGGCTNNILNLLIAAFYMPVYICGFLTILWVVSAGFFTSKWYP
jgi:hypothetical protein